MSAPAGSDPRRVPLGEIASLFAGSRLALLLAGVLAAGLLASGLNVQRGNLVYHAPATTVLDIWARWDSEWYLLIAAEGYDSAEAFDHLPVRYERSATAGFLPLYPLLIRILAPVFGGVGAGVLISNLCLAASCLLLFRLTAAESADGVARHHGSYACAALLLYPASLFLSAVYAESLHLMLALATFDRARRGRFAAAGACAFLAACTRPAGLLLALPLAVEGWERRRAGAPWGWCAALAPPLGMGTFMLYTTWIFGDPLAFWHRQERWRGGMSGPWRAFVRWWDQGPALHGAHNSTVEMVTACLFLAMLPAVFRKLPRAYGLYATAVVCLPLCSTLWSFGRLASAAFPVFMTIGMAESAWSRNLATCYRIVGAVLSGVLMALFAAWWWAG